MSVNNGSALALGRTPHGVRGLKYIYKERLWQNVKVAPLTGCVD